MQSRRHSLEEAIVSTALGLVISTLLNQFFLPKVLGVEVSAQQNLAILAAFTAASFARQYVVRRIYNRRKA